MRKFLQKYIRPVLKSTGIYNQSFNFFFKLINLQDKIINLYNKKFRKTAIIVTYHRIANVKNDPRLLCVSPEIFSEQLNFFKKNFQIVSTLELAKRLRNKTLTGNELAITFDDGYQDNLTHALPILEKFDAPATIFITTSQIGEKASFPWDNEYEISDRAIFLSLSEIKELAEHPLIEIGAHTHNHSRLSNLSYGEQINDISTNKKVLEKIIQKPILNFAYPFGGIFDLDKNSQKILEKLNFKNGYTTKERYVTHSSKPFTLPRFNMREYSIEEIKNML